MDLFSILICGKIRDEAVFAADIEVYEEWLSQGWIKRLVFSGWVSDRHHPLIARLAKMGARIVLSQEPVLRGSGNVLHQMKSLHMGLKEFAPDELVLKSRTDKVWLNFDVQEATRLFYGAPAPGEGSPFQRRVTVIQAAAMQPFFFNDMMFLGLAGDLHKLVSFNIWYEMEHALLNTEQMYHFSPFIDKTHASQIFFRVNPGLVHDDIENARDIYRMLLGNDLYLRALSESLDALCKSYSLGLSERPEFHPPACFTLIDVLSLETNTDASGLWFAEGANTVVINHAAAADFLMNLPISSTDGRTLDDITKEPPLHPVEAKILARKIVEECAILFPHSTNPPAFPYFDGMAEIVPVRAQSFTTA